MTDRDKKIYKRLNHDIKYVENLGYEVFGVFLQGSQNYKLDYEGSDIDTTCIVIPTLKDKIEKHGYDNKQLHHIVRCAEFLDRYIEGVPYAECLIPTNPQQLVDIKARYIYNLDEAKQIAKETVDTVKAVNEKYMAEHECVVNNEVKDKMDEILTDVIWASLVEDFYG